MVMPMKATASVEVPSSAQLRELLDHHEIRKLLSTYCHGCDRGDGAMMSGVYSDPSWDDHGKFKGSGQEYTDRVMRQLAEGSTRCVHLLGQALITVTGDHAGAESYFLATILRKGESDESEALTLLSGRYVDSLERQSGSWKIKSRVVIRDWCRRLDSTLDPFEHDNYAKAALSGEDPSYRALQYEHPGLQAWVQLQATLK
jgi:SnoaL-like domain